MKFSLAELTLISKRAITLQERFHDSSFEFELLNKDKQDSLIKRWKDSAAYGNNERFSERLEWSGLTEDDVNRIISDVKRDSPDKWSEVLNEIISNADNSNLDLINNFENETKPIPFPEFQSPFLKYAKDNYSKNVGDLFSDKCINAFLYSLAKTLSGVSSQTLLLEFKVFKLHNTSPLFGLIKDESNSDELYKEFISSFYAGGYIGFFLEYSMLARILVSVTLNHIDTINELAARFKNDLDEIQKRFKITVNSTKVKNIQTGLSDSHNKGRSVMILEFDDENKIVYKPKDLGVSKTFYDLIDRLNNYDGIFKMKTIETIYRDGYGWEEFIDYTSCQSNNEVAEYYTRMGQLLGIVYILDGNDCHSGNIIAHGAQPVIIDLETILNAEVVQNNTGDISNAAVTASMMMMNSIFKTGFLPFWNVGINGNKIDLSGLGGGNEQTSLGKAEVWQNFGNDDINFSYKNVTLPSSKNLAFKYNNIISDSLEYIDEILIGFENVYRIIMDNSDELLSNGNLLDNFKHAVLRYVVRDTKVYADVIRRLRNPKYLRTGTDWGIGLESLCKSNFSNFSYYRKSGFLNSEQSQLSELDIPCFTIKASGNTFYGYGEEIQLDISAVKNPFNKMQERLYKLSESDLNLQMGYIRMSFIAKGDAKNFNKVNHYKEIFEPEKYHPIDKEFCLEFAERYAGKLESQAIKSSDGSISWIAIELLYQSNALQLKPIGLTFHTGASGIAVFLACLYKITGNEKYKSLGQSALKLVISELENVDSSIVTAMGIGAGVGIGSVIYALSTAGELLNDESLINNAVNISSMISKDVISKDKQFDIIQGAAGCILATLKLYKVSKNESVLDVAKLCGDHIISNMEKTSTGHMACPTLNGKFHTGFSHGAAGLSLALLKLFEVTQDEKYKLAALSEIEYEQSLFNEHEKNYPDLRSDELKFMTSWCHGAPGIGVSRIESYKILGEKNYLSQALIAAETTSNFTLNELDQLCCGNFGRLAVLNYISNNTEDEKLSELVKKKASYIIERYKINGGFFIYDNQPTDFFSPGLFTGETGIAYALLYIAFPKTIPYVSIFE